MDKKSRKRNAPSRLYQKNHIKIGKAVLTLIPRQIGWLRTKSVMKKTKLSRQTINKHYSELRRAPILIQQEILKEYSTEIKEQSIILAKYIPDTNKRIFYILMLFMSKNRQLFVPICKDIVNRKVIYKMIEKVYYDLEVIWMPQNAPKPTLEDERVKLYISNCVEIICQWGESTGCDMNKSDEYVGRLIRLSREAYMRCR